MSVEVNHLVKIYGTQRAVDDISFEARSGEILGFLGPNGAGKSTTMKVLTQYIPADGGQVKVAGFDLDQPSMEAKREIGYLPEHNALYKDMYVKEYLRFMAGIHDVDNKSKAVEDIIERTGLGLEQHKKIGMLSKGYKQRVGLAQAMIHDPSVLILDEPTSGLDPNQLVEIRGLIQALGKEKTVIFSSHIMQEVQALCDRVVILDRGKIVADRSIGQLADLITEEECTTVQLSASKSSDFLKEIQYVTRVDALGENRYKVYSEKGKDVRSGIFHAAVAADQIILEMYSETSSVEDVFQKLTKS